MIHGALARKRHKKILKRRFVRRVKLNMMVSFGSMAGHEMYQAWRERVIAK